MSATGSNRIRWRAAGGERLARPDSVRWTFLGANPVANAPRGRLGPLASLALWLVGICLLCWMTTWIHRPRHVRMIQFVAGYQTNLAVPHNVPGVKSAEALSLLDEGIINKSMVEILAPATLRKETDLAKSIAENTSPFLVINFFAHGGYDEKGPFLIPDDADTRWDPENRIRVGKILEIVAKQPEWQVKVLVFDAEQFDFLLPFGIIENRFSQGLRKLEPAIAKIPNLIVVNSCGSRQNSWIIHDTGMSNFGSQLVRCLTGTASDLNLDGQVNLAEALSAVSKEVAAWSMINRNAEQTVMVLPSTANPAHLLSDALVHQAGMSPYNLPPVEKFESTLELRDVWSTHRELYKSNLRPDQLCPELWSVYQRALMRYEELLRADDPVNARAMREIHRQLESRIRNSVQFSLDSFTNNFGLGLLAGMESDEAGYQGVLKLAAELLTIPEGELSGRISRFAAVSAQGSANRLPPRILLQQAILEEAAKSPDPNPERIALLIGSLRMPGRQQPIEAQGVVTYLRDRAAGRSKDSSIPRLIHARMKAEFASCGMVDGLTSVPSSNRGMIFKQRELMDADAIRLSAQDRMLSSEDETRTQALRDLARASAAYDRVVAESSRISGALNAHNQLMSEMPFYTEWVLKLGSPVNPTGDDVVDALMKPMTSAWDNLHLADAAKDEAVSRLFGGQDYREAIERLITLTGKAGAEFEEVRRAHANQMASLAESDIYGEDLLMDDVLRVPVLDVDARMRVIETRAMSKLTRLPGTVDPESLVARPQQKMRVATQRETNVPRVGRLAMAMIGKSIFDDNTVATDSVFEPFDQVAEMVRTYSIQPDEGLDAVARAGRQIGMRLSIYEYNGSEIAEQVARARPEDKMGLLIRADRLARIGTQTATSESIRREPGSDLRRCWLNNLLVFQAKRAWAEHLYAGDGEKVPYYRAAMQNLIIDASKGPVPVGLEEARSLAALPGEISVGMVGIGENGARQKITGMIHWTTEPSIRLEFEAGPVAGGSIPGGKAQVEVAPGPEIQRPGERRVDRRLIDMPDAALALSAKPFDVVLESEFVAKGQDLRAPIAIGRLDSRAVVNCIYRGQRVSLTIPVGLHATPPVVSTAFPASGEATLSLRASKDAVAEGGQAKGSVAIVVDCSGSMGADGDNPGKIAQVASALEAVVGRLPPGVNITVWVFGQAVGPARTVDNPEEHVIPVLGPTIMGGDPSAVAARLARRFREGEIIPWNKSPLLSAMNKAAGDLAAQGGARGPMTLIALTDGQDNRAIADPKLNPEKLQFPALVLKLFAGSGIQVRVIGFQAGAEDPAVAADFEALGKLSPPGGYSSASHLQELVSQMENSMRRELRYALENADNIPVPTQPVGGFEAGLSGFIDKWIHPSLPPGEYFARGAGARGLLGIVRLDPADCLLVGLSRGKEVRRLGMMADLAGRPTRKSGGWTAGIAQKKRDMPGVTMLAALEKDWDAREQDLSQPKPGFAWWEMGARGGARGAVRFWNEFGYPSPCWTVASPAWPASRATGGPEEASLEAWWLPEKTMSADREFRKGNDFTVVTGLESKPIVIDGVACLVESVRIESRLVPDGPDSWSTRKCLVARTRCAPPSEGAPSKGLSLAFLDGHPLEGSQHLVHAEAGKAASIFWPVDETTVSKVGSIQFRSLSRIKEESAARGFHVRFDRTGTPEENDERPRPLLPFPRAKKPNPGGAP